MNKPECRNCKYAHKRTLWDLRYNGSSFATYECFYDMSPNQEYKYVRLDDKCEHFEKTEKSEKDI